MNRTFIQRQSNFFTNMNGKKDIKEMYINYEKNNGNIGHGRLYLRNNNKDSVGFFNDNILNYINKKKKKKKSLIQRLRDYTKKNKQKKLKKKKQTMKKKKKKKKKGKKK